MQKIIEDVNSIITFLQEKNLDKNDILYVKTLLQNIQARCLDENIKNTKALSYLKFTDKIPSGDIEVNIDGRIYTVDIKDYFEYIENILEGGK